MKEIAEEKSERTSREKENVKDSEGNAYSFSMYFIFKYSFSNNP